jgi:hypothetical protein
MPRPNTHRDQATKRDAERYFPVRLRVARDKLARDPEYQNIRTCVGG